MKRYLCIIVTVLALVIPGVVLLVQYLNKEHSNKNSFSYQSALLGRDISDYCNEHGCHAAGSLAFSCSRLPARYLVTHFQKRDGGLSGMVLWSAIRTRKASEASLHNR